VLARSRVAERDHLAHRSARLACDAGKVQMKGKFWV
jgi:hypothetical protein